MKILIDGDGCPVIHQTIDVAKKKNIKVVVFCDTSHVIKSSYAQCITVSKGADSVDFALVNYVNAGDVVVTQDYGLAAMVLSKDGIPITQNGLVISDDNLILLLTTRYESRKSRQLGAHLKGSKKRTSVNDKAFLQSLEELI